MGLLRKTMSFSTAGLVPYRNKEERATKYAKQTRNAARALVAQHLGVETDVSVFRFDFDVSGNSRSDTPRLQIGTDMIVLGVILLLIGYFTSLSILYTIGAILVVVGVVLWILGAVGRPVGGRKVWF